MGAHSVPDPDYPSTRGDLAALGRRPARRKPRHRGLLGGVCCDCIWPAT